MEEINAHKKTNYRTALIISILLLGLIIFRELRYYLGGFLAAVAMYSLLKGQMIQLTEKLNWSRGLSASIIVLASIIFILIPLTGIGFLVADTISGINLDPAKITMAIDDFAILIENRFGIEVFTPQNLSFLPQAGSTIMQSIVSGLSSMVINSIIAIFVLYFMLVSYGHFENVILEILPFSKNNKAILRQETKLIILSNTVGIPVVALTQGILAYIGYLSMGVSSPLVFAVLVAFTTVIPVVGTSLVWVPIGISALLNGDIVRGIILLSYGLLIIGGSDAILRFMLQKRLANIHPLITFFGVLMGLAIFGFWGIIFGPLLLSMFLLLLNMYRHDYIKGSVAEPRITTTENSNNNILFRKNK
ncbi:MAG TPA: AI-2E family transporter [Bacteroidales bacterium]|jgi:predicted PurR-regulated permease PerM|nr:AI-2E family transporter [Bacteroidales bacterium]